MVRHACATLLCFSYSVRKRKDNYLPSLNEARQRWEPMLLSEPSTGFSGGLEHKRTVTFHTALSAPPQVSFILARLSTYKSTSNPNDTQFHPQRRPAPKGQKGPEGRSPQTPSVLVFGCKCIPSS